MSGDSSKGEDVVCGLVMPISDVEPYGAGHWLEVRSILSEAVEMAGMRPRLVSESDSQSLIHKSIVQNIYRDEIVLCDVSSRNPNVMLELGMRLAFDKPVVIVKDDKSSYPFDTTSLQYIEYKSSLRYASVGPFKKQLADRLESTLAASREGRLETFLATFGQFNSVKINEKESSVEVALLDEIRELRTDVTFMKSRISPRRAPPPNSWVSAPTPTTSDTNIMLPSGINVAQAEIMTQELREMFGGAARVGPVYNAGPNFYLRVRQASDDILHLMHQKIEDLRKLDRYRPHQPPSPPDPNA